jgi:hypothetical protein
MNFGTIALVVVFAWCALSILVSVVVGDAAKTRELPDGAVLTNERPTGRASASDEQIAS